MDKKNSAFTDTIVSGKDFEAHLKIMLSLNYKSLNLLNFFKKENYEKGKFVVITFDDGHYSNYMAAFPLLKKYGFFATFFIVAGWIGKNFYLSKNQIQEMHRAGMEIGSHGLSHQYLPLLKKKEIVFELEESKRILENIIKAPIKLFAYPGGHYTQEVVKCVKSAGYEAACSCLQGYNTLRSRRYLLRRLEIRGRYSQKDFAKLFDPVHVRFYQGVDFFKQNIRKAVGLKRYSELRKKFYKFYFFKR